MAASLHAEHRPDPGHDLRGAKDRRDPDNGADHPAPGDPANRRRNREADDNQDRDRSRDRKREAHQRVRAGIKGRGLREGGRWKNKDDRKRRDPHRGVTNARESHRIISL